MSQIPKRIPLSNPGAGLRGEGRELMNNFGFNRLQDRLTGTFYKVIPFSQKPSTLRVFSFLLCDNDPSALGTRFNHININSDISNGKRNTFEVTSQTNGVRENRKVHLITTAVQSTGAQLHDSSSFVED